MEKTDQKFCASFAKEAKWDAGPRSFFEYRNLGIGDATHGAFHAHVIRLREPGSHGHRGTGPHKHDLKFQMFYVLKGWIRFRYEGQGVVTFNAGDCCLQPPNIKHDEMGCSDDIEILEITSPADFETTPVASVDA